ncbi:stemmadenine O-acetyltransferase-like [Humulus lupulus]|uniref:stemmadenine O-acetyltransferase-like n=1 Tax=Humulus lupulus TaxID=3486 RepID=UPI002B41445D|nr:stemmadenine O-acetyltransferase-like [Humulus lupulus]
MKFEVKQISTETVKPSSPTPHHLRHYQLSFLDQLCPKTYNPLVFYYYLKDDHDITEISNKIKTSLSEVLTLYYPLAGRVINDRFVDCNDEGVSYSVARVISPCSLSDALNNLNPNEICNLLPFELFPTTEFALGVQLNIFEGGGIAVGLCITHKLADALSCIMFAKTWVAVARGEADQVPHPEFIAATLFPPKDEPGPDITVTASKEIITKRFVFEATVIEDIRLRHQCIEERTPDDDQYSAKRPSRIESLSAFIWNRYVAATKDELLEGTEKGYSVVHAANIRTRLEPQLPEYSFGNVSRCGVVILKTGEEYGYEVTRQIREGIRKLDMEYLEKVKKGEDVYLDLIMSYGRGITERGGQYTSLCFSSLCRFPIYETDFGWGNPIWVSSANLCYANFVAFMDTKSGDGIEAYIALKKEHMIKLEADKDFLKAVSSVWC